MRIDQDTIQSAPDHHLFPASKRGKQALTAKQRKFAREVAMGATKADAYRTAYNVTSPASLVSNPYNLAANSRVQAEIEAIQAAITAEHIKSPAALRALVIQSLVTMSLDPNVKDATRLQALKTLGTVTEVSAFTARAETKIIHSSEDARARVLEQLRSIVKADAEDVQAIESDAESLLAELHLGVGDQDGEKESRDNSHTMSHEQSPNSPDPDPTPPTQEHPPS